MPDTDYQLPPGFQVEETTDADIKIAANIECDGHDEDDCDHDTYATYLGEDF